MVKRRKTLWIAVLLLCGLHLLGFAGAILFMEDYTRDESRSWSDIVTYLDAVDHIKARDPLYELDGWTEDVMAYHYHPSFALFLSLFSGLSFRVFSLLWVTLLAGAYFSAIYIWYRVSQILNLTEVAKTYLHWLPVVFVFAEFYAALVYGNVAAVLFFLSGLLSFYLVQEKSRHAGIVALLIALLKPQWLFPLILPVVFRRWRFLLTVLAYLLAGYVLVSLAFVVFVGTDYGIETMGDYYHFLTRLNDVYPWSGKTMAFEDMNHSWRQIFLSYFGFQDWIPYASEGIKLLMVALVGGLIFKAWREKITLQTHPYLAISFLALGYLLAMAMLAQLWELLASIVFFMFLQSNKTVQQISRLYLIYVFYEMLAILSFATGIEWLFLPQSIPLTMLALLTLYGCFLVVTYQQLGGQDISRPYPTMALSGEEKGAI